MTSSKPPAGYDARGLAPDVNRLADAAHIRRDAITDEITWPPDRMADVLRALGLIINEKDLDHDT